MQQEIYRKVAEAVRRREAARNEAVFTKIAERLKQRLGTVKSAQQAVGYNLAPQRDTFRKGMLSGGTAVAGGSLALSGLTGDDKSFASRLARILGGAGIAYAGNRYATDPKFRAGVHDMGKKVLSTGTDWVQGLVSALTGKLTQA